MSGLDWIFTGLCILCVSAGYFFGYKDGQNYQSNRERARRVASARKASAAAQVARRKRKDEDAASLFECETPK